MCEILVMSDYNRVGIIFGENVWINVTGGNMLEWRSAHAVIKLTFWSKAVTFAK